MYRMAVDCVKLLSIGIVSWGLGSSAFAQTVKSPPRMSPPKEVIISALGATYDHAPGTLPAGILRDIKGKGFTGIWDAYSPGGFGKGLLEDNHRIQTTQRIVKLLHENNLEVHFVFPWGDIYPVNPGANSPEWFVQTLNEKTWEFQTSPGWDFGNERSLAIFLARCRDLFKKVGRVDLFFIDEIIMADTGPDPHCKAISTYWTGGTYSPACLASFRSFLAKKSFPNAGTAKFPVTTVEVAPSAACNKGLPAVKITAANRDRLTADNDWPNSPLWKHWYDWRTDMYAHWVDRLTALAYEEYGKNPGWRGCGFCAPPFWCVPALGIDLDKLAQLKHLDYLVSGYMGGMGYQSIREAAMRHGKKWGADDVLWAWGNLGGADPGDIKRMFKQCVMDGASIMLVYPIAGFQTDRKNLADDERKDGGFYMPQQIQAWEECMKWLEEYQKSR